MRFERIIRLFSFALALAAGCGGSDGSSGSPDGSAGSDAPASNAIDCNWLTGPNCYKSTFSPALACLPDPKAAGQLSADGKTCSYAGGQVITFDSPVTLPLPSMTLLGFTLSNGATQCLKIKETGTDSFTLTTSAGTFVWIASGSAGTISATCPDGSSYAASGSSAFNAEVCASKTTGSPATSLGSSSPPPAIQFSLDGTGAGASQSIQIFNCHM